MIIVEEIVGGVADDIVDGVDEVTGGDSQHMISDLIADKDQS
jgi:hypothetical protein